LSYRLEELFISERKERQHQADQKAVILTSDGRRLIALTRQAGWRCFARQVVKSGLLMAL